MFNGIIKKTGVIKKIIFKKNNCDLEIKTKMKFSNNEIGSSISCSGTCLTLEKFTKDKMNNSIQAIYKKVLLK